jgi:Protein of unknown function (DUF3150)
MSHQAEMILDQIDVVKLDITLWTSSKKLRKEDLVLATGSRLPPEELAHLGTKKTIDPQNLKEFNRLKKEAERICLDKGTRFLGGFANPKSEIPRIKEELDCLAKAFYAERDNFMSNYETETKAWIQRHEDFGDAIRRAVEPAASVAAKLRFDYVVFHVSSPLPVDGDLEPVDDSLNRRASSLSDQLFREIAQDANDIVERSFVGKDTVTGRVLNAFRRMRNKLNSLGFLDHRCMPVVDQIDAVLTTLPKAGPYNGSAFHDLFRLGLLLSDPTKVKQHGGGLLQIEQNSPVGDGDDEPEGEGAGDRSLTPPVADNESIQLSLLDRAAASPTQAGQPDQNADSGNDDLPDFDAFMATYAPNQDTITPANEGMTGDIAQVNLQDTLAKVMDSISHEQTPSLPSFKERPERDLSGDGNDDQEPLETNTETAVDFWF